MKLLIIKVKGTLNARDPKELADNLTKSLVNGILLFDDTVTYEVIDCPEGIEAQIKKNTTPDLIQDMINQTKNPEDRERLYMLLAKYK